MKHWKHWQDAVNGVLGAWLILSPWILGLQQPTIAMVTLVVAGAVLLAAAIGAVLLPSAWEERIEAFIGLLLIVSPWLLGFSSSMAAVQVALVTGIVVLALALWVLATDKDYGNWWSRLVG